MHKELLHMNFDLKLIFVLELRKVYHVFMAYHLMLIMSEGVEDI